LAELPPRFAWRFLRQGGARRNRRRIADTAPDEPFAPSASPPKRSKLPVPAQLRQQLGMTPVNRAVFEIASDVFEILRHSVQHLAHVSLISGSPAGAVCSACSQ
jgi:hypothetical protein